MLTPGTVLGGRYRLDERIASGGMGDVWRGTDEVLGRTVAVKVLLPALLEEPGFAERFRGEARTMATINHPGVVDVYDYGSDAGTAFLIMEYVEGDALSRTLGRVGRLTPGRTMALVAQAAEALHAAHLKGIVHRDVKPGNLLVRPNGTLVLTDFGIARSAQAAQLTAVGAVLGTAAYISPEQASGQQATPLSDLYALGVVAYQCLAGRRPFDGDNPIQLAMCHVSENPPQLPGDIPPAARQLVERAMAKAPADRWPTAAAMAQAARQAAAQPTPGGATTGFAAPAAVSGPPTARAQVTLPIPSGPPAVSAQQGGFARGAAGVPPPPPQSRTETGYAVPPPRTPGNLDQRRIKIAVGAVSGAVVLVCATIGLANLLKDDDKGTVAGGGTKVVATTSRMPTKGSNQNNRANTSTQNNTNNQNNTVSGDLGNVCITNYGKQEAEVRQNLLGHGYQVTDRQANHGGDRGQVFRLSPCTPAAGARVTIWVSTGRGTTPSLSASVPQNPDEQDPPKSPEGKDLPTLPKLPSLNQSCDPARDTCPGTGQR